MYIYIYIYMQFQLIDILHKEITSSTLTQSLLSLTTPKHKAKQRQHHRNTQRSRELLDKKTRNSPFERTCRYQKVTNRI